MLRINTINLTSSLSYLGGFIKYLDYGRTELLKRGGGALIIDQENYAHATLAAQRLTEISKASKMVASASAGDRVHEQLLKWYRSNHAYSSDLLSRISEPLNYLLSSFNDELASRVVVEIPLHHAEYINSKSLLFGDEVAKKFSGATLDISEAGKCLAVSANTAAVFHLMRSMEYAVREISSCLAIQNVEREWGKLLSDIDKKIEVMPKGKERNKWSEVHSHLYHVKEAWRNETMHPGQHYSDDEARAIFNAVKVFMGSLASVL